MNNLVSVIVPAYNAEKYIGEAIKSVLSQTYPYFELIIVDDASTDSSVEVVRSFNDDRIRLIQHDKNRGPGAARNTAIEAAKGEWMAILDADDQWLPERLEKLMKIALKAGEEYFIADDLLLVFDTPSGLKVWGSSWKIYYKFNCKGEFKDIDLEKFAQLSFPGIKPLIPLKKIKNLNIWFPEDIYFGEDLYFWIQLLKNGLKLRLVCESLYLYRITPGSLTANPNRLEHLIKMNERLLLEENFSDRERIIFEKQLEKINKEKEYNTFATLLKQKKFKEALSLGIKKPNLFGKLLWRLPKSLRYRTALWLNRGKDR
ncbi:glycosyltransferase [Thermoanaerobacter sp. RKWS2]|uniref:glycosyltransferase n=1 Tax=Thermoanaerobacter sp. RKWS2 TaxID=2983842 RepID=UPI001A02D320|nr:glycosyltransferase family 2 protein [Thermoanaerobacter sp. RKWS2]MBE3591911.1 glycosyltransferase family 2 protein [Thermoanaerobacter sp.]UZQ83660.1 glycosyltransferase family 2 protein [Thermoanaerobacter sp. RKWS2]